MKLKIKVKEITEGCMPVVIKQGDWIDLKLAEDVKFTGPEVQSRKIKYLSLGIAMELPKGFEAYVLPRSSTPNKWNIEVANSQAIIDESYKGDEDEWKLITKAFKAIDGKGLSRVDFFIDKDTQEVFINEINTFPGFTSISMYPKMWEVTGIGYTSLITNLIELAESR